MTSETPTSTDTPRAVVRSAPMRRGRKRSAAPEQADKPETIEFESLEPATDIVSTEDVTTEDVSTGDDSGTVSPDQYEQALTYRERRAARVDGSAKKSAQQSPLSRRTGASPRRVALAALAMLVVIGCVVASVIFASGINRFDRDAQLRGEYSTFAREMIVNLTTLSPETVDEAMAAMEQRTSGRALQQLQESMEQATGLIREQGLSTESRVITDAVTHADDDGATVILVFGWHMDPPSPEEEAIYQTFRGKVDLTRINGDIKMTNFEWVS